MYDSSKVLDIATNITNLKTQITDINTKLSKLGQRIAIPDKSVTITAANNYRGYTDFTLPIGTWNVSVNVIHTRHTDEAGTIVEDVIPGQVVAVCISDVPNNSTTGYVGFNENAHMEIPRSKGRYTRFMLTANLISNSSNSKFYVNFYDTYTGIIYIKFYAHQIGI